MLELLINLLSSIIAQFTGTGKRRMEANLTAAKIFKSIGMFPQKNDFKYIYLHALLQYSKTKDKGWVRLLSLPEVVEAYRASLKNENLMAAAQQAKKALKTNRYEVLDLKILFYDQNPSQAQIAAEIDAFSVCFRKYVDDLKTPAQIAYERKMEKKSYPYQIQQYYQNRLDDWAEFEENKGPYIHSHAEKRRFKLDEHKARMLAAAKAKKEAKGGTAKKEMTEEEKRKALYEVTSTAAMDDFFAEWLQDSSANLLIIMGEYGTGKTTFTRYMCQQLSLQLLGKADAESEEVNIPLPPSKNITPIYLPLRNFERTLQSFISTECRENYGINDEVSFQQIKEKAKNGEWLLVFDGFDEMTQRIDASEKKKNFKKLQQLITQGAKVVLTCREEYFRTFEEMFEVFAPNSSQVSYQYCFLQHFTPEQIQRFLEVRAPEEAEQYWEIIENTFDLEDLAKRPVLLDLIVKYLPALLQKHPDGNISASNLYQNCIADELGRKNELEFLIPDANRLKILQQIALWLYHHDAALSFDINAPSEELKLRQYFDPNAQLTEWEYERQLNEFLIFTFLLKEGEHQFRISHKSFRDYLMAEALVAEINGGKAPIDFGRSKLSDEILHFMEEQNPNQERLLEWVLTSKNLQEDNQWQGSNALNLLFQLDRNALVGQKLENCQLMEVNFEGGLFNDVINGYELFLPLNLKGITFHRCLLKNCIFEASILGADMKDCDVSGSSLNADSANLNDLSPLQHLTQLNSLSVGVNQITDISPLQHLTQLNSLNLSFNQITDISPLQHLTQLNYLYLQNNQITNISPLQHLTQLNSLSVYNNQITDISPLQHLTQLNSLDVSNNQITDISPLQHLTQLNSLDVSNNQVSDAQIKELEAKLFNLLVIDFEEFDLDDLQLDEDGFEEEEGFNFDFDEDGLNELDFEDFDFDEEEIDFED